MNNARRRVLVQIDEVLIHIFHDKLVRFLRHISVHEAREVEEGVAVERGLVVQELVRRLGRDAHRGHLVLGHGRGVFVPAP